jgi:uncharacterized membrane protein
MEVEVASTVLALGAMLCLGLSDLLNKRAMAAGIKRTEFLVVQSVFFTLTTLVLIPVMGGLEWSVELLYAVVCGVITFGSYVFVLKALEVGEASVATPIYRMSFAVTVLMAVLLLDEDITATKLLGFVLIVIALVTLTAFGNKQVAPLATECSADGLPVCDMADEEPKRRIALGLTAAFALVAMVTIGTKGFLYKVGVSEGAPPATFALVQSLTFLPIAIAYMAARDGGIAVTRSTLGHAPYNGVLTALASVLLLLALEKGEAVVAVPISQLCFVVTAVLAVAFFKERLTGVKVVGIIAAIAAVLLLSAALPLPW